MFSGCYIKNVFWGVVFVTNFTLLIFSYCLHFLQVTAARHQHAGLFVHRTRAPVDTL